MNIFKTLCLTLLLTLNLGFVLVATTQAEESTQWVKKSKTVTGEWVIEQKDDGDYLVLDENFKTSRGPDLKLMLSKLSIEQVNGSNAADGSLTIAPLKSAKGKQSYKLPEGYLDYQTLLIHCEKFSKLWSASNWLPVDKGQ
jgi:hypothetical protein